MSRRRLFTAGLVLATAIALIFLLLPLVAIFLRVPPGDLVDQLGSEVAIDAIIVTLKANAIAQALILVVGTPAAYLIASRGFRGRDLVVTLVELPLVLPPAVAGIGAARRLRSPRAPRQHLRRARDHDQLYADGSGSRRHLRRLPLLPPPGDRLLRGARPRPARCFAHARSRPSADVRAHRASAGGQEASRPVPPSLSPAGSASSARRSCSPAASRA